VEVCTPPALLGGEWRFVDLELDPYRGPDGRVVVDDEDEFVAACAAGSITPKEAAAARAAAAEVEGWLTSSVEPFGQVGLEKLRDAAQRGLAPLRGLPHASSDH
jgi:predicted RNA-binding protein associated with RNAse of E/G family